MHLRISLAGEPAITSPAPKLLVTQLSNATTVFLPNETPLSILAYAPIQT